MKSLVYFLLFCAVRERLKSSKTLNIEISSFPISYISIAKNGPEFQNIGQLTRGFMLKLKHGFAVYYS
jgi:hypothetical protein